MKRAKKNGQAKSDTKMATIIVTDGVYVLEPKPATHDSLVGSKALTMGTVGSSHAEPSSVSRSAGRNRKER